MDAKYIVDSSGIKEHTRIAERKEVHTFSKIFFGANMLEVEVGTNGYKGGNWSHGSRTYLRINGFTTTDFSGRIREFGSSKEYCFPEVESLEICFMGDSELATVMEALRWVLSVLEKQVEQDD